MMDTDPNYPRGNTIHEEIRLPQRYHWKAVVYCQPPLDEKLSPRERQARREAEEQKKEPQQPNTVKNEEIKSDIRSNLVRYMRGLKGIVPRGPHPDQFYIPDSLIGTDREGWYDRCLPYSSPIKESTSALVVDTRDPGDLKDSPPTKSVSDVSATSKILTLLDVIKQPRNEKLKTPKSGSKLKKVTVANGSKELDSRNKKQSKTKCKPQRKKKDKLKSSNNTTGKKTKTIKVAKKAVSNHEDTPPSPASPNTATSKCSEPEDVKNTLQTNSGANIKGLMAAMELAHKTESNPVTQTRTGARLKTATPTMVEPIQTSTPKVKKSSPKSTAAEAIPILPEPRFSMPTTKQIRKPDKVMRRRNERSQSVQYTTPKPSQRLAGILKKSKSKPKNTKHASVAEPMFAPTHNVPTKVDLPAAPLKMLPKIELDEIPPSNAYTGSTDANTESTETNSAAQSITTSSGGITIPTDEMEPFPVTQGTRKRTTETTKAKSAESTTVKVTVSGATTNEDEDEVVVIYNKRGRNNQSKSNSQVIFSRSDATGSSLSTTNANNVLDEARKYFRDQKDDDSAIKRNTGGGCTSRTRITASGKQTPTNSTSTSHESARYFVLQPNNKKQFMVECFDDVNLKYLQKRTKNGYSLGDCLNHDKTATKDIELSLLTGLKACDSECYLKFKETFRPTIEEYHKTWMIKNYQDHQPDFRLEMVPKMEFSTDHIDLFTAKLYRNFKGLPFALSSDMKARLQTERMIKNLFCRIATNNFDGVYYSMCKLTIPVKLWLVGKGMWINPTYFNDYSDFNDDWQDGRGVWMSDDRSIVVYINGYEHITVYANSSDNQPWTVIKSMTSFMVILKKVMSSVGQKFSKHSSYGHLTARPEFIGNGLTLTMEFIKSAKMPAKCVVDIANKNSMIATSLDRSRQLWRISTKETLSMTGAELFASMMQTVSQLVVARQSVKYVTEHKSKLPVAVAMGNSKMKREESAIKFNVDENIKTFTS